jgi:hypothetical protein
VHSRFGSSSGVDIVVHADGVSLRFMLTSDTQARSRLPVSRAACPLAARRSSGRPANHRPPPAPPVQPACRRHSAAAAARAVGCSRLMDCISIRSRDPGQDGAGLAVSNSPPRAEEAPGDPLPRMSRVSVLPPTARRAGARWHRAPRVSCCPAGA